MLTLAEKSHVVENMGLIDRAVRLLFGIALLGITYYYAVHSDVKYSMFEFYSIAIALYPIFTGMFGWDPVYAMLHARTCGDSGRHQCGTLPYQMKAMLGLAPKYCETDAEHSLESCHDEAEEHPRHKVWRVDPEPMLYPDDKAWHRFVTRNSK